MGRSRRGGAGSARARSAVPARRSCRPGTEGASAGADARDRRCIAISAGDDRLEIIDDQPARHAAAEPPRRFQAVEDGLEIPLETRAEQRVAAVPTGDEDSVPLPRPVGRSGHCPNRPKSTSATSPSGGSTTRTVTAAAPNPSWRRAKRRGRPMWGGPVAVIAATLASVGSVLPRHRSVATPAACYLAVRSRAGLWFQWAKSFGEPVGRILQILAGACAEPQIFEQWPSICYSPNQRTIMNRGISDVQGSSHP
jgi:hypothetical protein